MDTKTEYHRQSSEILDSSVERHGNVVDIKKPEGEYTVIYGAHFRKIDSGQLPKTFNGMVLEGVYDSKNWKEAMIFYVDRLKPLETYSGLFPVLEQKRIPIFSTDVGSTQTDLLLAADASIILAETAAARVLLKQAQSKLSRRAFLKGATLGAAAYLSLPFVSLVSRGISQLSGVGDNVSAELTKVSRLSHPEEEVFSIQIRNAIIAAKEKILIEQLGERSHLTTAIGGNHVDIEDRINESLEDNLGFIRRYKPLLGIFNQESLYTSYRYDFDGKSWKPTQVYSFPQIQEVVS